LFQFDRKKSLFLPLNSLGIENRAAQGKAILVAAERVLRPRLLPWRASIAEFRRNSYAVPWYSLPPDLVVAPI